MKSEENLNSDDKKLEIDEDLEISEKIVEEKLDLSIEEIININRKGVVKVLTKFHREDIVGLGSGSVIALTDSEGNTSGSILADKVNNNSSFTPEGNKKLGTILTNFHVIENGYSYEIIDDNGDTYPAELIAIDRDRDLALLQACCSEDWVSLEFSDQNHAIGEKVAALGYPATVIDSGGEEFVATFGVLSSESKLKDPTTTVSENTWVIQTDAAINGGNSGGPLINSEGYIIGVNTFGANVNSGISSQDYAVSTKSIIGEKILENMTPKNSKKQDIWNGSSLNDEQNTANARWFLPEGFKKFDVAEYASEAPVGEENIHTNLSNLCQLSSSPEHFFGMGEYPHICTQKHLSELASWNRPDEVVNHSGHLEEAIWYNNIEQEIFILFRKMSNNGLGGIQAFYFGDKCADNHVWYNDDNKAANHHYFGKQENCERWFNFRNSDPKSVLNEDLGININRFKDHDYLLSSMVHTSNLDPSAYNAYDRYSLSNTGENNHIIQGTIWMYYSQFHSVDYWALVEDTRYNDDSVLYAFSVIASSKNKGNKYLESVFNGIENFELIEKYVPKIIPTPTPTPIIPPEYSLNGGIVTQSKLFSSFTCITNINPEILNSGGEEKDLKGLIRWYDIENNLITEKILNLKNDTRNYKLRTSSGKLTDKYLIIEPINDFDCFPISEITKDLYAKGVIVINEQEIPFVEINVE